MLDRIRESLPAGAYVDLQQMFGLDFFICHGVAFAAAHQGDLVVRLDEDAREEALTLSSASTWGPNPEVEDEFVIIPYAHISSDDMLRYWVTTAYEYAEHLAASDQVPTYSGDMAYDEPSDHDNDNVLDALPPAAKRKKEPEAGSEPREKAAKPAARSAKAEPAVGRNDAKRVKKAAKPVKKAVAAKKSVKKAATKKKAAGKPAAKKKSAKKPIMKAPAKKKIAKKPVKKAPAKKKPAKKAPAKKKLIKKK